MSQIHAHSLANLQKGKRFGHGQPTNMGGAPTGKRLSTYVKEIAEQEVLIKDLNDDLTRMPVKQALAVTLFIKAIKDRNIKAIEALFNLLGDQIEFQSGHAVIEHMMPAYDMILQQAGVAHLLHSITDNTPKQV